jgi:hypothetical protein
MRSLGVHGVFGPGSAPAEIVEFIRNGVRTPA